MRVLDLFSGIGGFSLGLERAGMNTVAFCEIDPYCRKVLAKHWPKVPIYHDIRELSAQHLTADGIGVDLICGGFPCQDISVAGKNAGIDGTRSGLWSEFARIIGEVRPRYVIVENVAALLGRGLKRVLGDLSALGYDAEWHCIPASAVGAPHRRDRIWIVAQPSNARPSCARGNAQRYSKVIEPSHGSAEDALQMADTNGERLEGRFGIGLQKCSSERIAWQSSSFPHPTHYAAIREGIGWGDAAGQWRIEPDVGRVAHGVSDRTHRLRLLGNAVVPQIPEIIGRAILAAEQTK